MRFVQPMMRSQVGIDDLEFLPRICEMVFKL
jgi:hypothetical protein